MNSAPLDKLRALLPHSFLVWWFERADLDELRGDYEALLPRYFTQFGQMSYVWHHYNERYSTLAGAGLDGKRILDVGCGIGTEVLWAALHGARSVGIELHRWSLSVAQKRLKVLEGLGLKNGQCELRYQDLFDIKADEKFDIILLRETFHHLEPRLLVVDKLASLIKQGGWLIIEETNGWNPVIQLKYLAIRGRRTVVIKHDKEVNRKYLFGNERITTAGALNRLFRPYGITGKARYFRFLPTRIAQIPALFRVTEPVERLVQNSLLFRPLCLHYTWVGRKERLGDGVD